MHHWLKRGFYCGAGPLININDIAGAYSGIVFGITNTFGTLPGIICPYIVGVLTKNVIWVKFMFSRELVKLIEDFQN